jgi:hypothetical protein
MPFVDPQMPHIEHGRDRLMERGLAILGAFSAPDVGEDMILPLLHDRCAMRVEKEYDPGRRHQARKDCRIPLLAGWVLRTTRR